MANIDVSRGAGLAAAAAGELELDIAITGAQLLDVYRAEWVQGDLGIYGDRIAVFGGTNLRARETIDATGKWVVPGFFESHYHAGGTHLSPRRLAREFLRNGTTASVCDFQEFYVVGGKEAARAAVDSARASGLRLYYLLPTQWYVLNNLAHPDRRMPIDDMWAMLDWPETVAINEPPPGPVRNNDSDIMAVIDRTLAMGKLFAGHAPSLSGSQLQSYTCTGASSDHESTQPDEAWEKLALGMRVMMRHGSAAPDMQQLIGLAKEHPLASRYMMLVSDEVDPNDLIDKGHLDHKVRLAVASGIDPITAMQLVTINPAEYYRIDHEIGSLAPGRFADVVVLGDLDQVAIETVFAGGRLVDPDEPEDDRGPETGLDFPLDLSRPLTADDFVVAAEGLTAEVRVIAIEEGSLLSKDETASVPVEDGNARPSVDGDVAKMALIERSGAPQCRAVGFTRGFALKGGAVATTYAHSFYNLLVVGTDEELMALAANTVADMGGGVAVVDGRGTVLGTWQLPMVGVFADTEVSQVRTDFNAMNDAVREIGCPFASPLLSLSFVALPTIPALGMTHGGLYDVEEQKYVEVVVRDT